MKRKVITEQERQKYIKPEEKLTFTKASPIVAVSLASDKTVCFAIHGIRLALTGGQGTIYAVRIKENIEFPLNIQEYSFNSDHSGDIEIKGPLNPEYHWTKDLPLILERQAPGWVKRKYSRFNNQLKLR